MLTFIDESGYPRPTDSTKNPILLGVCIHENDIKPITNQIYKLKDSIYGKQDEIKCHASNYSSHLRQLFRRLNPTSPFYRLS